MTRRKLARRAPAAVLLAALALVCVRAAGVWINTSPSIPLGFYVDASGQARIGEYVRFCPPPLPEFSMALRRGYLEQGSCASGVAPLMKRVLAAKGDVVDIDLAGVRVNGKQLTNSVPLPVDADGNTLGPHAGGMHRVLADGEILLMSDADPKGFDARYFGPIQKRWVTSVIRPLFTW